MTGDWWRLMKRMHDTFRKHTPARDVDCFKTCLDLDSMHCPRCIKMHEVYIKNEDKDGNYIGKIWIGYQSLTLRKASNE